MRLSKKTEYACLALVSMARDYQNKLSNLNEIAENNDIPRKFLEQILAQLKSANYIQSIRGPKGGYTLAKAPAEISLAEIARLFDGAIGATSSVSTYFYRTSPIEKNEKIHAVFKDIRDYTSKKMEATHFSDLI